MLNMGVVAGGCNVGLFGYDAGGLMECMFVHWVPDGAGGQLVW